MYRIILRTVIVICAMTFSALATVPQQINYQGLLTDEVGDPVTDGSYSIVFAIYDSILDGNVIWTETQSVTTILGLFSVKLGIVVPLTIDVFSDSTIFIGLRINGDPELSPRTQLLSIPYSFQSKFSDSARMSVSSLDKTVDASELSMGTLSIDRFSAYEDVIAEGKLGFLSDQLSPGDHSHSIGSVVWLEDTTLFEQQLNPGDGDIIAKTLTIPANTIEAAFRITWTGLQNQYSTSGGPGGGPRNLALQLNSVFLYNLPFTDSLEFVDHLEFVRTDSTRFIFLKDFSSNGSVILDTKSPIEVTVVARNGTGQWTYVARVGSILIEF